VDTGEEENKMPKRAMSWVLIVWNAIFLIWIVGAVADRPSEECPPGDTVCQDASDVGTGIGVSLILIFWFMGFVALSLVWFMTRPKSRMCPVCGTHARKGETSCRKCGHDFAAAASGRQRVEP
jgi:hypothetical protein